MVDMAQEDIDPPPILFEPMAARVALASNPMDMAMMPSNFYNIYIYTYCHS